MEVKKISLLFLMLFIIPFVSSLNSGVPLACGGNEDVVIGCIGNEDLIFLGADVPAERTGQGVGGGADVVIIPEPKEPIIKELSLLEKFNTYLKGYGLGQADIYLIEILLFCILFCFIFFIWKRRKKEKDEDKVPTY